ncbi:hypothetical protein PIB30_002952 [Stylosanthes scabra]|uniref:Late embryogenesis abundant protein LEA-2 subgroup domain-containing protein n=1 Tax=Stylosanthes scabra TaxID=79078 RepID=A0ABU6V3Y6_9FABA|nr:hypothetical protein [Stylosanthes scabra]
MSRDHLSVLGRTSKVELHGLQRSGRCSVCCIYFSFYAIFFSFVVSIILFWIIISPSSVKFHVTNVSLTQFNLTNNTNTLNYKFKVNITARNPNNKVVVYYRGITAILWYKDRYLVSVRLAPFDQGHKNTSLLQEAVFEGQSSIRLGPKQIAEYYNERSLGIFNDLAVDLDFRIRAKFGRIKSVRFNPPIVQCRRLRVPLISNGKPAATFNVTRCSSSNFFADRDAGD